MACHCHWLGFFGGTRGHFLPSACTNAIPKLRPRHYITSAVTPELAAKTSRQSFNSFGHSFGAQSVAKMCLCFHSTAVLRCDWKPKAKTGIPPGSDWLALLFILPIFVGEQKIYLRSPRRLVLQPSRRYQGCEPRDQLFKALHSMSPPPYGRCEATRGA